ncbi:hypothetical protein [Varibaculum massiliense]|uniref:hypothetical protein n=1 Tax=Varibaculum massiliense TaxID=1852372 RepID=UPI0008DA374C|nr:hypothetical protein [Varibaculum massiliense]
MAKLTVTKVAQRCLELADQLKPQLADPRMWDLRSGIEQTRRALDSGELPRWQVKRLVDTVALAAMLSGKGDLAEKVFGLWMKAGQSISQNPASLVLQAIPDLGKNTSAEAEEYAPPAPQPQVAPAPAPPSVQTPPPAASLGGEEAFAPVENPQPQSVPEHSPADQEDTQALEMSLAAMISEAYAAANQESANHAEVAYAESSAVEGQHSPVAVASANVAEPATSAGNWRAPSGEMPWIPVQTGIDAAATGSVSPPARPVAAANNPPTAVRSTRSFPARRSLQRPKMSPELPPAQDYGSRLAPPPPEVSPLSAAPPANVSQPASAPPASSVAPVSTQAPSSFATSEVPGVFSMPPEASEPPFAASYPQEPVNPLAEPAVSTSPAPASQPAPLPAAAQLPAMMSASSPAPIPAQLSPPTATPSAAPTPQPEANLANVADGWEYFRALGLDSQLNMSFDEFIARKKHASSQAEPTQTATSSSTPRSAFVEVADDMPDPEALYGADLPEEVSSPADSALLRAAQSPLMPSQVPPAAPHKPREILAEADRQPSTRLITIRVRGYFDYRPRFTRPKQSLDEPAVAGSTESFAKSIIGAEGPMPLEFLARRLCQKYRIGYNERRPDEAGRCLGPSLKLVPEPGMRTVWPTKIDPLTWNTALQSPIGLPRKLGSLTLTEVANALRWQISRTNNIERAVIVREAFQLLYGITAVTPQVTALCDRAISYGIANNLLAAGDGTLWLP